MRYLLLVLLLSGCASPEQKAARDIVRYAPYCETLGYQPNTNDWRQCVREERANAVAASQRAVNNAATLQKR